MMKCIVVRGGGDLATGVIHALAQCGFFSVVLETGNPSAIRRKVSLCEAVYEKAASVEGVSAYLAADAADAAEMIGKGRSTDVPLLIDENCSFLSKALALDIEVTAVVDAVIAKRNLGTNKSMASVVVALGPGFTAGTASSCDADAVIETMRGHNLGRIITDGSAAADTGVPGIIAGFGRERVVHAPAAGIIEPVRNIGDIVTEGEVLAYISSGYGRVPVISPLGGVLRGMIHAGYDVPCGMKIADVDPRKDEQKNCFTISDKSRALGNSTLHALLMIAHKKGIILW
jgi:xanthine dehydrogenase accessory factor